MQHNLHKSVFIKLLTITLAIFFCLQLCGCSGFPIFFGSKPTGGVLINEVVTSNSHSLTHELLGSPDWIELYNSSNKRLDLGGCGLSDNLRNPQKWVFPEGCSIGPKEYMIVYATKYDGELPKDVLCTGFGLSKSGESLYLTDTYVNIIDEVSIPALPADVSYARDNSESFGFCAFPTPGEKNAEDIKSSLAELSYVTGSGTLAISEVMPVNQSGLLAPDGRRYAWLELHNPSSEAVRLFEYYISDSNTNFFKWQLPDIMMQPGEYLIVYFYGKSGKENELFAPFKLGRDDSALYLSNGQGGVVDELSWETPAFENVAVINTGTDERYTAFATPGEANSTIAFSSMQPVPMEESDPIILNEVLVKNRYSIADRDGDRNEWVELYNRGSSACSLLGYYLSDDELEPAKWAFPDVVIEPGEYLIVFLSGKESSQDELHASFGLSSSDEVIMLTNLNGLSYDVIPLDPGITQNVSLGRDDLGQIRYFATPTPRAKNDSAAFETLGTLPTRNPNGVFVSEVSAVAAAKSGKQDWIELYNPTNHDISLAGWHISDDINEPYKYKIKNTSVAAKGYALLYASSHTSRQAESTLPFGISGSGDTIFLTDPNGILRDYFETGTLRAALSSGRNVDNPTSGRVFYTTPTPGLPNTGGAYSGYAATPVFSRTELYFDEAFELKISCATPGASIYYTTDGSKPNSQSAKYTGPITISGNTPVRVIAIYDGLLNSEIVTHTYLREQKHTLPVVCINGDQADISSVYAAREKSERVEREMHMEYFESSGRLGVCAPIGLRASGASTLTAAQKSFTMFFRGGYGQSNVNYPFFEDYHITNFSSLVIRNSGQDRSNTRLRDSFISLLAEGLYIDNVATRPVVMYLNGKYWGIYDLNENQNQDFLASHYGVDPDAVDIIRRNVTALSGKNSDFKRVRSYGLNKDLSVQANFEEYCQWVDMDYVMDYLITQTFFANNDMFNQKYWRSQDNSVKWRPVLFDLDFSFSANNPTRDILYRYFIREGVPSQDGSLTNMDIFCGLKNNASWCDQFVARYVYVVEHHYSAERLTSSLDEFAALLRPEMDRHIKRWGSPNSVSTWENNVKAFRDCLEKRPANALKFVQKYFNVSDAQMEAYKQAAKEAPFEQLVL
ncbi:lamin tail domain-containing protein [Eubacteriales bacterium OttesenSCG-928-K08]|nr:lamin tail domain-containing protein [Eubacteriales bacterium OttesenSCG-928-K08]